MNRRFQLVDVFHDGPFSGNPLGVVVDADGLSSDEMQEATQWLLSSGRAVAPYTASQGTRRGRTGRIFIDQDRAGTIWVGGRTSTRFSGVCSI